jgi:hypothetical protein
LLLIDGADPSAIEVIDRDAGLLELLPSILLTEPEACASHLKALASLTASATISRTGVRPDLPMMVDFVERTLPRPSEQRKDPSS